MKHTDVFWPQNVICPHFDLILIIMYEEMSDNSQDTCQDTLLNLLSSKMEMIGP